MKIAHIVDSLSTAAGGMQTTVAQFAGSLTRVGHEVKLFGAVSPGEIDDTDGLQREVLPRLGRGKISLIRGLNEEVKKFNPELIIQHGIWSPFVAQVTKISKEQGIPLIISPHGMLDPYILNRNQTRKQLSLRLYQTENLRRASSIRALNENERLHVLSVLPNAKVFVLPNGILPIPYSAPSGKPRKEDTVLFLGRIDHKKGVHELIEGWLQLEQNGKLPIGAELRIVGWGDENYINQSKKIAEQSKTIAFPGPKFGEEKYYEYSTAGAFILPSKGEGLPTSVLEAWTLGCLPIFTKECNFDLDAFNRCAIQCGQTANEVADSLIRYFNAPSSERSAQRAAGKSYVERYDWNVIAKSFNDWTRDNPL